MEKSKDLEVSLDNMTISDISTEVIDGIEIKVQVSDDLKEWTDAGESVSVDMIAEDETIRTYEAKLDAAITDGALKRFMRLSVK